MDHVHVEPSLVDRIVRQSVPAGTVGVWWLGQSSLVLKAAETTVYVDPYLAASPKRLVPPPIAPENVANADLVLLTHDHSDHIDAETLPALAAASPDARFVAPRPVAEKVGGLVGDAGRVTPASNRERLVFGPVGLVPVAAKHEEFDEHPELGYPYLGYVLDVDGVRIYLAGDTLVYEGLVETLTTFRIDLAFLPINGRDFFRTRRGTLGNMSGREAADLAAAAEVDTVVPVHYGMFAGNTVPPGEFVTYLSEAHPGLQCHVLGQARPFLYQPGKRADGEAAS